MADRTALFSVRVTPAEHAAWRREKAVAAGMTPSALLRQAMVRVGANTHASVAEAVSVIAHLVSFERSLLAVARVGEEAGDAR